MKNCVKSRSVCILILIGLCICLTTAFVIISVAASSYSVMSGDDFIHAYIGRVQIDADSASVVDAFKYSAHMYRTWQGTYFSMFLQSLLSPLHGSGIAQLRVVMILNCLGIWASMIFVICSVVRLFSEKTGLFALVAFCMVYSMTSYYSYDEIFWWFSGAVSYSFPLTLLLVSVGILLVWYKNRTPFLWCISAALGLLAMGGSLSVAGIGCYTVLLICLCTALADKHMSRETLAVFLIWVAGALVNAAAPGNYVRYGMAVDETQDGVHFFAAIVNSFKQYKIRLVWFNQNTDWIIILGIALLAGVIMAKGRRIGIPYLICSALMLPMPYVSIFPVVLGYNEITLPNRVAFVFDMMLMVSFINLAFVLGNLCYHVAISSVDDLRTREHFRLFMAMAFCIIVTVSVFDGFESYDNCNLALVEQLADSTYSDYRKECIDLYSYLESCEDSDVALKVEESPGNISYIYNLDIRDPEIADKLRLYYGLSSITVTEEGQEIIKK